MIHRDLKPANVLLASDGSVKITDFGLAKLLPLAGASEARMTESGMILGTPAYIAPEQARGHVGEIGPASDIYALGAILYELLTGRPPFQGPSPMETLLQAARQEPVPVTRLAPRVPRDLNTICLKCLEKDAQKRYVTAADLATDLGKFLDNEPILARPIGTIERSLRWARRRPALATVLLGSLLLATASVGGLVWLWQERAAMVRAVHDDLREVARLEDSFERSKARAVLDRAETRLGRGGPSELRQRVDRVAKDLMLASRLDSVRSNRQSVLEGRFNNAQADRDYEAEFGVAGFGDVNEDPALVAARVRASSVHRALVAALSDWAACATGDRRQGWVLDVARKADDAPDPGGWGRRAATRRRGGTGRS